MINTVKKLQSPKQVYLDHQFPNPPKAFFVSPKSKSQKNILSNTLATMTDENIKISNPFIPMKNGLIIAKPPPNVIKYFNK